MKDILVQEEYGGTTHDQSLYAFKGISHYPNLIYTINSSILLYQETCHNEVTFFIASKQRDEANQPNINL